MSQNHSMHVDNETTIKEVLKLVALSELLQENIDEIQSNCNVNGSSVLWSQLHNFCQLIIPRPKKCVSFADQLSASARQIKCYIDSELSAVVGTTYHDLRQFVEAIDISSYFDCSFSESHPSDVSSFHLYEENLSRNGHQLSGDGSMVTLLNDAEQLVMKVEAAASDVNSLSTALNADGIDLCNNTQMAYLSGQCRRGRLKSGRPTSCSHCGKQFPTPSALSVHMRTHTGHRPFVCSHCSRNFTQLCHLTRHIHHRHATSRPYVCAYCHKAFASVPLLRKHLQIHGVVTTAPSRRIICYSCDVCGLEMNKRYQLNRHLRIHTQERPFLCSQCGRSFADASYFYRHQQSHLPAMTLPCPVCGKNFASMELLRQHQTSHSDARPHACDVCGRGFKRVSDLHAHSRTHSGVRPYSCKLCSATFTQAGSLRYHMLIHSDERSHTCSVCARRFRAADKLRIHTRLHSGERPHTCDKCGRNFGDRSALRRHMRVHVCQQMRS